MRRGVGCAVVVSRQPLYMQIVRELENRIDEGAYRDGSRLPSEPELAEEFGVSRGTLREALGILEQDGYLSREHGKGSFIRVRNRVCAGLEKLESLTDTIRNAGCQAEDRVLDLREETLGRLECRMLGLPPDSRGFVVESIRLADGKPVIYCYDAVPMEVAGSRETMGRRRSCESMTEFLRRETPHVPLEYESTLTAVLAAPPVSGHLEVPEGVPLIRMRGVIHEYSGRPLNYGTQFFNSEGYQFRLVRK